MDIGRGSDGADLSVTESRKTLRVLPAILGIVLAGWNPIRGESPPPPAQKVVPIPNPITMYLHSPAVFRDLKLRHDQIEAVAGAVEPAELSLWKLRDLPYARRNEQAEPLFRQLHEDLTRIFTIPQRERFQQLLWQRQGATALLDPEIQKRLDLSEEQIRTIQTIFADLLKQAENGELLEDAPETDTPPRREHLAKKTVQDLIAVLSNPQRRLMAKLQGDPFDDSAVRNIACKAPPLQGVELWLNSPPLQLQSLQGKVVILHFYTSFCGNCIRNLPFYNDWYKKYPADRVQMIGIHTPEGKKDQDIQAVRDKIREYGIAYPVAVDQKKQIWDAWANDIWPAIYLMDKNGFVRYWWYGELQWQGATGDQWIEERLAELMKESP